MCTKYIQVRQSDSILALYRGTLIHRIGYLCDKVAKGHTRSEEATLVFILPTKICLVKAMVFPLVMYGCESWKKEKKKESWGPKNWCFWTVVLEKTLESPLDCKEIQPVHLKGNQSRIFIGRTDAEAETPILWTPDVKNWLIGKDPDAGKDWRREEKGMTEDEMVEWHHQLCGHEFEQAPGVGEGQGSLVSCSPWGHKGLDMTERLNWLPPLTGEKIVL